METMNPTKTYKIDLQLLKNFGLSLDTKKKYFMIYDPQSWCLMGVYDNLHDALVNCRCTLQKYNDICSMESKYDVNYIGHNWTFSKGFYQNLNVWDMLQMLHESILEEDDDRENAMDYVLSQIHSNMHSYPDYMAERCSYSKI